MHIRTHLNITPCVLSLFYERLHHRNNVLHVSLAIFLVQFLGYKVGLLYYFLIAYYVSLQNVLICQVGRVLDVLIFVVFIEVVPGI